MSEAQGWMLVACLLAAACAGGPRQGEPDGGDPPAAEHAFRGVGQEPGWTVTVTPGGDLRAVLDYGEREVVVPAPTPQRQGTRLVYDGRSADHVVRLVVDEAPCSDSMSGEAFSHTVLLVVDGRELSGCGRPLSGPGAGIDGAWTLVELGGAPALASGGERPHMTIEGGRVGGNTGCNTFGGGLTREGEVVAFREIFMTRRACVEQALNEQEGRFASALEAADRLEVDSASLRLFGGGRLLARFERRREG